MHSDLVWVRDGVRWCDGEQVPVAFYKHVASGREFWFYKW